MGLVSFLCISDGYSTTHNEDTDKKNEEQVQGSQDCIL